MKRFSIAMILLAVIAYVNVSATIITIPEDYPTIQQGIDAGVDGDTVLVLPGTYMENVHFLGRNIVLGSLFLITGDTSYISSTIINAELPGHVVTFQDCVNENAQIIGFLIKEGLWGGIYCYNSNPTIRNNRIIENFGIGETGGGITCIAAYPTIIDNAIIGNSTNGRGGGIYCWYSDPYIANNIISENYSGDGYGGGIFCEYSNATILNNVICGNSMGHADSYGGGIACMSLSNATVTGNVIKDNQAVWGGGIVCSGFSDAVIRNNIISDNKAEYGGGILSCFEAIPTITNNTICKNWAVSGGGIYVKWASNPIITNTIFWADSAHNKTEIYAESLSSATLIYCNVQDTVWPGVGNISVDPLFRDGADDDYHLMSIACGDIADSPCIDTGDPLILDSLLDCGWGLGRVRSDIGAYGGGDSVTAGVVANNPQLPDEFTLSQNYPNPFNCETKIKFTISKPDRVKLTVYDLVGREVRTLINEYRQAGIHTTVFDATGLSSGVYFYRLQAGEAVQTRAMVLLK
ncbi:MAG: right-handed parallel beta-helix repeat-containing protein [Candidatus Zixiibacteriota bacterium]|nr:MAG: right-handed parallel beta-helix repeat-containing protein [candidate division Zixibacteria bacterium]